ITLVNITAYSNKLANDNSVDSSASSENDKKHPPFSLDSLQNLPNQTDINISQAFIQLDQFYPSIDKNVQISKQISNDDDDDLLSAAAMACTQMNNS
ncbi:unnamed protein product, partial [Rotaria magnacalcarata]